MPEISELFGSFGPAVLTAILFGIVFAESGVMLGFFLPGDSLLVTAGLFAARGALNVWVLCPVLFVAAVTGDSFGYGFGRRVGPRVFEKPDAHPFRHEFVRKTQSFYARHGPKTIVLARFVPIVRTFAPILAGVGRMEYRRFLRYNIVGGFVWSVGLTLAGFFLGNTIEPEVVDRYLLPAVGLVILASLVPVAREILKIRAERAKAESDAEP